MKVQWVSDRGWSPEACFLTLCTSLYKCKCVMFPLKEVQAQELIGDFIPQIEHGVLPPTSQSRGTGRGRSTTTRWWKRRRPWHRLGSSRWCSAEWNPEVMLSDRYLSLQSPQREAWAVCWMVRVQGPSPQSMSQISVVGPTSASSCRTAREGQQGKPICEKWELPLHFSSF